MSSKKRTTPSKRVGDRGLKPKLRFPEFRDESAWDDLRFSDLYVFESTNTFSRDKLNYKTGTVQNIHYGDIHTRFPALLRVSKERIPFVNLTESLENIGPDSYCIEGDIVFADASEDLADVGKSTEIVSLSDAPLLSGTHTILARRKGTQLIVGFGGYLFRAPRVRAQIRREAQGSKVFGISSSRLSNIQICFPPLKAEQRKIVACLSSLDDVIVAQALKVDALRTHKAGLLQELFPREGEALPRLRFPKFHHAPKWVERRAGELFASRTELGEAGLPIYSVTTHDGMVRRASFDRDFYDIAEPAGNRKACKNDIAYNMMRMWQGAFGVAAEECMVSPAYVVLAPRRGVSSRFFSYLLKLPKYLQLLTSHSQGLTNDRLRLYYKDFASIPLLCPSLPEQQAIADFLSSVESLISAHTKKLETLKNTQKGLMQQLFPSPEKVEV